MHCFAGLVKTHLSRFLVAGGLIGMAIASMSFFFQNLSVEGSSLGIDWHGLWIGLQGGLPRYGTGLRNPPWSLVPVLPLGLLSFRSSWAILTLVTIATEVISVPPRSSKKLDWPVIFFLVTSYPSLRNIADGNLEFLTIAGVLTTLFAYHARRPWLLVGGLLLASAKPQETWLLLAVLMVYVLRTWPRQQILLVTVGLSVIVTITMMFFGREWITALLGIEQRGSIMDIGLQSTLARLQSPSGVNWVIWMTILGATLYVAFSRGRPFDRCTAGLLMSASLLLSPYAAGNSLLAIVAIGVVTLFRSDLRIAVILGILINLPYLTLIDRNIAYWYGAYYDTAVLISAWGVFAWKTRDVAEEALAA